MNFFNAQITNVEFVTQKLIQLIGVKVNKKTISESLKNHPDYPSLLSISDCLTEFKIVNQGYNISRSDYDPEDLLFPFLAHCKEDNGKLLIVTHINDGIVTFTDEHNKSANITEEEFLKRWDGIALHAEKTAQSGEVNFWDNYLKFFLQGLVLPLGSLLVLSTLFFVLGSASFSWPSVVLCLVKFLGLCVSILLLMQSINSNNPLIKNLCGLGGKNDCNAILKSDASKITSWLSWSEVGFFYFAGSLLQLIFNPSSINFLAWLNVFALPYTIYSIGYQLRFKKWCVLCCVVQFLLVLEFVNALGFGLFTFSFGLSALNFFHFVICFLTPILIWAFLKPFFLNAVQLAPIKEQLKKFKYDSNLFNQVLTNQPRYAIHDDLMPITLGNTNAENIITMVSNPVCGPCSKAHKSIMNLLESSDDLRLNIIFSTNNDNDERTKVAQHLTAYGNVNSQQETENILRYWYEDSLQYKQLAEKYPLKFNGEIAQALEKQKNWCDIAEMKFTPTILINGYKLPEPYGVDDLKYLVI
ncbi:hypothetical protein DHW03_17140 [Pedobacter yonginense]|uniref:Peptidase C39 domain-containing protein n=1 Tax=Pedobacter yonginense TaxID=651869 RepID=A0A317EKW8_9SPHI|nr:thioredoxin domain-containing protein [Pedobacter yonginense]PWS26503.1 hypothetical protein DHW03_17140 [Pedobacter yonginense]